jgi:crotonobetainyl-CoA:carnitine CoA-transferase CaiB-like acyl-CoA transferase
MVTDRRGSLAPPVTMILEAADGRHVIVQTPLHFEPRLTALLGEVPGFADRLADERFATMDSRRAHLSEYLDVVAEAFRTRTSADWLSRLQEAGVPVSAVHTADEALAHPQIVFREATTTVDIASQPAQTVLASPFRIDGDRRRSTAPPPTLGEHTDACLSTILGYEPATIDALAARGAFGPRRQVAGVDDGRAQ